MKNKRINFLVTIFIVTILGYSHSTNAQNSEINVVAADTIYSKPVVIKTHSPHKATFYSAILPGLGQAYNKKYWKIPILYAGIGGVLYGLNFNTQNYNKYRRAYRDILIGDPGNTSYLNKNVRYGSFKLSTREEFKAYLDASASNATSYATALKNQKEYYKKYRDLSYVGLALAYVLNLVDASVDAHFKTFDVSNDLSMRIEPKITPMYGELNSIGMQVRFTF